MLRSVTDIGSQSQGSYKSLQAKEDLLQILIEHERSRLRVWLFPLEPERKHHMPSIGGKNPSEVHLPFHTSLRDNSNRVHQGVTAFLRLAWSESPGLAIQLAARFPSPKMQSDVRWLILNFPEKAITEAGALEIMFDSSLPSDVNFQLKVCSLESSFFHIPYLTVFFSTCCTGHLLTRARP